MPPATPMPPQTPRRLAARGFTLVELMIALVMISIITVLLFSALRLGSRAWEGVEVQADRLADLRVARNVIERSLRQARPMTATYEGLEMPVFAGDAERMEWVAPLSEHVGVAGLYILRLQLEDAGEYPRLVLIRWLLHPEVLEGGSDHPAWQPIADSSGDFDDSGPLDRDVASGAYGRTVLLPRVAELQLSYFGIGEGEPEPEWLDEWLQQSRLPLKVRIAVATPEQTGPAAVIELPGAEASAMGLFDDHGDEPEIDVPDFPADDVD